MAELTFDSKKQPSLLLTFWDGATAFSTDHIDEANGKKFVPWPDKSGLIARRMILLPSRAAEYGSQDALVGEIRAFIRRYCDVEPFWEELMAHYAMMTWVYDKFSAVPYLRFQGEPGSGKTRALQVTGSLCYKAIFGGGATTISPLFRLLDVYRGTFVIDEADYRHSDLWSDIVKILNSGYMRGVPVMRTGKDGDSYEPQVFEVFGPKILSTREEFKDHALETRCITLRPHEHNIRPDIPRQLPEAFDNEAQELRNKLLRWRFERFAIIQADEAPLSHLEPRQTQIGTPLYNVSWDAGFQARLIEFLADQGRERRAERPESFIVEAIRELLEHEKTWPATLTVSEVSGEAAALAEQRGAEIKFNPKVTGGLIRSLGFESHRGASGYRFDVTRAKLAELEKRYPPAESDQ
jgi:hypothetical protein